MTHLHQLAVKATAEALPGDNWYSGHMEGFKKGFLAAVDKIVIAKDALEAELLEMPPGEIHYSSSATSSPASSTHSMAD